MGATDVPLGFVGLGHTWAGTWRPDSLAAGYTVFGGARVRENAQHLIDQGLASGADTPRAVAEASAVVFSSVPDDRVLGEVASGPDGILAGLTAGKTFWVEVSTVSPHASRELAERVRAQGSMDARRARFGERSAGCSRGR